MATATGIRRKRIGMGLVGCLAVLAIVGACNSDRAVPAPPTTRSSAPAGTRDVGGPVNIRWFVGAGGGIGPEAVAAEKAFVTRYNAGASDTVLSLDVVPNADAINTLKTEIAAGNAPDIIGPMGTVAVGQMQGLLLDLTSEIKAQKLDLGAYEPALLKYLQQGTAQVGLPYSANPGFIFYNKQIFTKGNLPALPTRVGETYMGQTWDWGEAGRVAARLTLDSGGYNSTQIGFTASKIVQYGLSFQWADARRIASTFGGGSFVAPDGKTAQIPAAWTDAFTWYYDSIWKGHFTATDAGASCTLLLGSCPSPGDPANGHVAMTTSWPWAIPSYVPNNAKDGPGKFSGWDMAVMPSWKGQTSSPLDLDSFQIARASKAPDQAFRAMAAMLADPALTAVLGGGMPARTADQKTWFAAMDKAQAIAFPGNQVAWSVLQEMAKYPAMPSHEAAMLNGTKSGADIDAFLAVLQKKSGLSVAAELDKLRATLQLDFNQVFPD